MVENQKVNDQGDDDQEEGDQEGDSAQILPSEWCNYIEQAYS